VSDREIRLSQTVSPFGVGAIYDFRGESLIAMDTTRWKGGRPVLLDRLAAELGVGGFRSAPAHWGRERDGMPLPFLRFPRWLFCPRCRDMVKWTDEQEVPGKPARCLSCAKHPQLVPMRFVVACEDGHLGDVHWDKWAHDGAKTDAQKQCHELLALQFLSRPEAGVGLRALSVRCAVCGSEQTLDGITSGAPNRAIRCSGRQPWAARTAPCTLTPLVLQRGASNLYFAEVRSAIDILHDADHTPDRDVALAKSPDVNVVRGASRAEATRLKLRELLIADGHPIEQEERERARRSSRTGDLRREEWHALRAVRRRQDPRSPFVTRHEPLVGEEPGPVQGPLAARLDDVVLVTRLREVRALKSFRRLSPEGTEIRPSLDVRSDWLPAIEVFGEGLFLSFEEGALQEWERRPQVRRRVEELEARRAGSFVGRLVAAASPRFVLLHTFAHLLVRRLSFECGYTAASLRERIYCAEAGGAQESFAGVLVYTAAGDAEGTLGGLVRQGRAPHMAETILAMLQDASWCSSDPICIESRGQGFESLNRGACHACTLLSETSCEYSNALLDRAVVVGDDGVGMFGDILAAALTTTESEP
jgi:hypothetical protein